MRIYNFALLAALVLVAACGKKTDFKRLPDGPIKHHLIALAKDKIGVRARGFAGATPANTEIFLEIGETKNKITSESDGSFSLFLVDASHDIEHGEFTFTVSGKYYQQGYKIRDQQASLNAVVHEAFHTDKEVDGLSFINGKAAVLSAQANLLRMYSIDEFFRLGETANTSILLSQAANYPSFVATIGGYVAVSMNLDHEIALIEENGDAVKARAKVEDDQGQIFKFNLPQTLTVKNAIDADLSGNKSTSITTSMAQNPDALIALDDAHFLAAFTNYYQFENESTQEKAVVGPGVIALMSIVDGAIKTSARLVLPYKNPRHFLRKDKEEYWLAAAGAFKNIGKANMSSDDAGLIRIKIAADKKSMSIEQQIPLTDFAPGMPALVKGKLIIPRMDTNEIAVIDETATMINDSDRKRSNFHRAFSFTFAQHWHDDIVFLGDSRGTLVAYSVNDGYLPFPFSLPILIDSTIDEKIGLRPQMIYFRHHVNATDLKTSSSVGFDAWIVSDTQQKIFPAYFLEIFGP